MNIDKIRELLEKYYEGSASNIETDILKQYFRDNNDIPEDLRVDAAIFRDMATMKEDVALPENLEQLIIDSTIGRKRRNIILWKVIPSVAASLALLTVLTISFISGHERILSSDEDVMVAQSEPVQAPVETTAQPADTDNLTQPASTPEPVVSKTATPEPAIAQAPAPKKRSTARKASENNYIEVYDSIQAAKISSRILAKLESTISRVADKGIRKTEIAVAAIKDPVNAPQILDEISN